MKRFYIFLVLFLAFSSWIYVADAQDAAEWMPDANLRTAVRASLGLADGEVLTQARMLDLTDLRAAGRNISTLTGLAHATNLTVARLAHNQISDLSPLSGLTSLTKLRLQDNSITSISSLSGLTALTQLFLNNNQITDVSPLSSLVNLEKLRLTGNNVTNAHVLGSLTNLNDVDITIPEPPQPDPPPQEPPAQEPVDVDAPSVSISVPTGIQNNAFDVTITFTEVVSGFTQSDVSLTGTATASITAWTTTDNTTYTATITPTTSGTVTIGVAANVATDAASNQNTAATSQTVNINMDTTAPSVSISVPSDDQNGAFNISITFTEAVSGFAQSDVSLSGTATASITAWSTTDNTTYTATITPTTSGTVTIGVAANVATDAASNQNSAATSQTVTVLIPQPVETDTEAPSVSITVPTTPQNSAFSVTITFTEAVSGFAQSDLSLTTNTAGATITSWTASEDNTTYTAEITPTSSGEVAFSVPAGVATDAANNNNTKTSETQTVTVDVDPPGVSISVRGEVQKGNFFAKITFTESVAGFVESEVVLTSNTAGATRDRWSRRAGHQVFWTHIKPTTSGEVSIKVPAGVVTDAAGNLNTASETLTITIDMDAPGVSISAPSDDQTGAFDTTITFTEVVSGFAQSDVTLTGTANASITAWNTTDNTIYTATITPTTNGTVTIGVAANVATDAAGNNNTAAISQTVTVVNVNENRAPTFAALNDVIIRRIAENTGSSVDIGSPIVATDPDENTLTYSLDETSSEIFGIDSTSGQLRTHAALDYETKSVYIVTITADDGNGGTATANVVIRITNVNEAPVFATNAVTFSVAEDAELNTLIGSVPAATDPDVTNTNTDTNPVTSDTDTLTYSLDSAGAQVFSIDSTTRQLKTNAALDYETTTSYTVTVTVSDSTDGLTDTVAVTINVTDVDESPTSICDRTPQVRDAIVAAIPDVDDCANVTAEHLAAITDLNIRDKSITALKTGDFDGLTALTSLALSGNALSSLPSGIFDDNTQLTQLRLGGNALSSLPSGVFDNNTALTELYLYDNVLSALPSGIFDNNTALIWLYLYDNALSSLPSGVFDNNTALTDLYLYNNALSSLPAGIFDNNTALTSLSLGGNDLSSLPSGVFDNNTALTGLTLSSNDLSSLPSDIFDNLTELISLSLGSNDLSSLPSGIFNNNTALKQLLLSGNDLSSLPSGIFDNLTALATLWLGSNDLSSLPSGVFDNNTELTQLYLSSNDFSSLPSDIFDNLTTLTELHLGSNDFSSLPSGIFDGLTALTSLDLSYNTVNPLPLTVSLEKVGDDQFKAVAPTGAPFNIVLPLTVANGSMSGDASSITISRGGVESTLLTVTRTAGTTAAVTMDIGTLPGIPPGHSGYTLVKSDALPLEVIAATQSNTAPVFTEGDNATRAVAENTVTGENIGNPITATDANSDTLTYTLGGTDAASFSIVSTSGQLQTSTALDYETKTSYSVTITVSDGNLTDTISVTINVTDVGDSPTGICDRTPQIRDVIVEAISDVDDCADVTAAHLAAITSLYPYNKGITSLKVSDFDGLTALRNLDLGRNSISDLTVFKDMTALEFISLSNNSITDISALKGLTSLTRLELYNNSISDISALKGLTSLKRLLLSFNSIKDISALKGLTSLVSLSLSSTAVTDISALENLTSLTGLYLASTSISDISALEDMTSLTTLVLYNNSISDISALENLTSLKRLYLEDNSISDISALEDLTSLNTLNLSNNSISDISALENLTSLRTLYLSGNLISDYGPLRTLIAAIKAKGRTLNFDIDIDNNPPVFTDGDSTTRSVAENTAAGQNIGTAVGATDTDGRDTLTYTLGGTDAASFSIVRRSGQLRTKAALDYETKTSYTVTITVSDGNDGGDSITVTVNVTDVAGAAPSVQTPPAPPNTTALLSNYPNPFNPETWIPYQLAKPADVTLTIYNLRGVVVREIKLGHQPVGLYRSRSRAIHWDGRNTFGEKRGEWCLSLYVHGRRFHCDAEDVDTEVACLSESQIRRITQRTLLV